MLFIFSNHDFYCGNTVIDISIHQSGYPSALYQENGTDQCLANYTLINENQIDDSPNKGITCSRKDSTANGTWTFVNDGSTSVIECDITEGPARCVRPEPGSITLYTKFTSAQHQNGSYACCIEGLCIYTRIYAETPFIDLFPNG